MNDTSRTVKVEYNGAQNKIRITVGTSSVLGGPMLELSEKEARDLAFKLSATVGLIPTHRTEIVDDTIGGK
jgi:hypothetical protein